MLSVAPSALEALLADHPALASSAPHRPVLPNLVDGSLLIGHQGHALKLPEWAPLLKVTPPSHACYMPPATCLLHARYMPEWAPLLKVTSHQV